MKIKPLFNQGFIAEMYKRELSTRPALVRLVLFAAIFVVITMIFVLGVDEQFSLQILRSHRHELLLWTKKNLFLAGFIFFISYVLVVVLFLPGAIWMTLVGGFLFGTITATALVVTAATVGAMMVFLMARYLLASYFHTKLSRSILKLKAGFESNALNYIVFLRLVPLFPFWLVNIVPAFSNMSFHKYVVGTFLGIIPGSAVYCSIGNGLGEVFDRGDMPNLDAIFELNILIPMIALAFLSLIPIAYRLIKRASVTAKADESLVSKAWNNKPGNLTSVLLKCFSKFLK